MELYETSKLGFTVYGDAQTHTQDRPTSVGSEIIREINYTTNQSLASSNVQPHKHRCGCSCASVYIYIYIYICLCVSVFVYVLPRGIVCLCMIECACSCVSVCVCVYVYMIYFDLELWTSDLRSNVAAFLEVEI